MVTAGYHAPSAMNRQTWQFTVVQNKDKIESLAECLRKKLNRDSGYNFYRPDVFVLCSNDRENFLGREDCAVAIENMMLAAHELGLGSCWIHRAKEVMDQPKWQEWIKTLGLTGDYEGIGNLVIGYIDGDYPAEKERKEGRVVYVG